MPTASFVLITLLAALAGAALGLWTELPERAPPEWIIVGQLSGVPDDGEPHRRLVTAARWDGWRRLSEEPIGTVFVRRAPGNNPVTVLEGWHGGDLWIPVEYDSTARQFHSCCGKVSFRVDGASLVDSALYGNRMRVMDSVVDGDMIRVRWSSR